MDWIIQLIALFLAAGALPPPRWGLRIAALLAVLLTLVLTTSPSPDVSDWDSILFLALPLLCGPILAGVTLRFGIAIAQSPQPPSQADASKRDQMLLARTDQLLLAGFGLCLGCFAFRALAVLLQAAPGGLSLHTVVAALALLPSAAVWRTCLRSAALGAGLLVAALSLDGALRYPDLILTEANRLLPGQPRCLMLAPSLQPPRTRADLMALTMAKDRSGPSAALLLIDTDRDPRLYRWSFRARSFVPAPAYIHAPKFCIPTETTLSPP